MGKVTKFPGTRPQLEVIEGDRLDVAAVGRRRRRKKRKQKSLKKRRQRIKEEEAIAPKATEARLPQSKFAKTQGKTPTQSEENVKEDLSSDEYSGYTDYSDSEHTDSESDSAWEDDYPGRVDDVYDSESSDDDPDDSEDNRLLRPRKRSNDSKPFG